MDARRSRCGGVASQHTRLAYRSSAAVAAFGTEGRAAILAIVIDEIVDLVKNVYGKSLVRLLDLKERRPE